MVHNFLSPSVAAKLNINYFLYHFSWFKKTNVKQEYSLSNSIFSTTYKCISCFLSITNKYRKFTTLSKNFPENRALFDNAVQHLIFNRSLSRPFITNWISQLKSYLEKQYELQMTTHLTAQQCIWNA